MPTTFSGTIWADALLDALETRIVTQKVYPRDGVWCFQGDANELLERPPRDAFAAVSVVSLVCNPAVAAGAGNVVRQWDSVVSVAQYQRLWTDKAQQSAAAMKDRSRGLLAAVKLLYDALQMWDGAGIVPTLGATVSPLVHPVRIVRPVQFNGKRGPAGWASAESFYGIDFRAP